MLYFMRWGILKQDFFPPSSLKIIFFGFYPICDDSISSFPLHHEKTGVKVA